MRLRNIPGAKDAIASSKYVVQEPEKQKAHGVRCLEIRIQCILRWEWEKAAS